MTNHIRKSIEQIIFKGGFVNANLEKYIEILSQIRHPSSIEEVFEEALMDIENKEQIHPSHKETIYNAIEKVWANYPKGEKELYKTGTTTQIENGVKVTKTYRYFSDIQSYIKHLRES